jgi:hypothetical protein
MSHINPFLLQMVDEILFYEWDPIGINHHLVARDEYGAYAGDICRMLQDGCEQVRLAHHLRALAEDSMGLSHVDQERDRRVASRLLDAQASCRDCDPRA